MYRIKVHQGHIQNQFPILKPSKILGSQPSQQAEILPPPELQKNLENWVLM